MTTFNVMIDDLGRIVLPTTIRDILNTNHSGDSLTIGLELDEKGRPCVSLITAYMKTEIPKAGKEETKIYTFYDEDSFPKVVKITKEQDKFFDWLIEQDYFRPEVEMRIGLPEIDIEDLTK